MNEEKDEEEFVIITDLITELKIGFIILAVCLIIVFCVIFWNIALPLGIIILITYIYYKKNPKEEDEISVYRKQAEKLKEEMAKIREKEKEIEKAKKECEFCLTINNTIRNQECVYCGEEL